MSSVFGDAYAGAYDRVYGAKDYEAECDDLERLFDEFSSVDIRTILDLGCGTGGHATRLAQRGYEVVGVDVSESMLDIARGKSSSATFTEGDIRSIRLDMTFDAVICMFAVLSYQTTNDDLAQTLQTVRTHLQPSGLFLADFWYGPAVLSDRPGQSFRRVESEGRTILRASKGAVDEKRHVCSVEIDLWELEGERLVAESHETHDMRFLFPQEMDLLLADAGMDLLALGNFPPWSRDDDRLGWNVMAVARGSKE